MTAVDSRGRQRRRHAPWPCWAAWVLLGLVVLLLSLLLPPSGDDWRRIDFADHTLSGYLDRSWRFYREHNGRVLGNLLSFLLMDPWWLRALVKAVTVVGLVAVLQRVTGSRRVWGVLPAVLGVLLVPAPVFRQALAWSTGFFYYVPPVLGLVLLAGTVAGCWDGRRPAHPRWRPWRTSWWTLPGAALLGMMTCLFIEPVTVAAVGLAVGGAVVAVLRGRHLSLALVGWVVGTLAGTAVMLASPGLRQSLSGGSDYYGAPGESVVGTAVVNYSLVTGSFVLSSVTVLGMVLLACLAHGGRAARRGRPVLGRLLVAGAVLVGVYAVPRRLLLTERLTCRDRTLADCDLPVLAFDLGMLVLLLVLVVTTGLLATAQAGTRGAGRDRAVWVALLVATLLLLGPLLVVEPIGPRNLYAPLVTLTGMAMVTLRPWVDGEDGTGRGGVLVVRAGLATVTAGSLALVGVVAWANAQVFADRVSLMEEAVAEGRDEVELPPYPHPRWVHGPDDDRMGYHYYRDERYDIDIRFAGP
ncbi:DUF6056 family protein [Ornithinimicrobium sufpigmenti]|uniref:DUF6056 family protein n=1 Tax=Ornithinimicrobium sufpigmenti TaxID=2508882 RepID=UPI0010365414|nr:MULTISPECIES: DUF6056 family protein [unclassified Ornithinimicrobium]